MYDNPEYGLQKVIYPIVFLVYLSYLYITQLLQMGEVVIELLYLVGLGERGVEQYYLV